MLWQLTRRDRQHRRIWHRLALERLEDRIVPSDVSPPPILQFFEGTYQTIEKRMPDLFNAGYGQLLTPPPGRADSGNQ